MFFSLLIQSALAQEVSAEDVNSLPPEKTSRSYMMETNVRVRTLFLPDSILDTWFYDKDTVGAYQEDRPDIRAYTIGVEYVFNQQPGAWVIWAEYMGSGLMEGYWDDIETGETANHDDGDWVRPDNFSAWWAGVNYAYDIPLTPDSNSVWLSLGLGGGLGAGYITGDLTYWKPGSSAEVGSDGEVCAAGSPAYVRKNLCEHDGIKEFPRFLPMIDITFSPKINFANRAHIRFDAGFHDLLYYGAAVGGIF